MSSKPKQHRYEDIADSLAQQIRNGQWEVGARLPSFVDMYREHGATPATMQRVYDLLEKESLVERRARSGVYVTGTGPMRMAPRADRSGVLAVVLPHFGQDGTLQYMESSYTMRILRGMHQAAAKGGFQITLGTLEEIVSGPRPVDGLLLHGVRSYDQTALIQEPVVSLITHFPNISSVGVDDFESYRKLTGYLIEKGHRRIAALLGSQRDLISPARVQGYEAALGENGIGFEPAWYRKLDEDISGPYHVWGYDTMCRWLKQGWADHKFTALITQNDAVAVGAIKAVRQYGYRVPQDISVAGFDNAGDDWHFDLKLTSAQIPLEEIGSAAVEMLIQRIEQPHSPIQNRKFPTQIVEGESTMPV